MMKLKAIIMDGDGSTITHDGILPDNLRDLILKNSHIKWIMATGRSLDLLRRLPIIEYLSRDVPHIVDGGSRLVNHDGTSLIDYHLSPQEITNFFAQLETEKIEFLYYYLDELTSYIYSQNLDRWHKRPQFCQALATSDIGEYETWAQQNPPTKIFMRIKAMPRLNGLNWHQNEQNIDLTAHGVSKGSACVKLLSLLQLSQSEVAFVFNDKNDLPLIEHPNLADIIKIKVGNYLPTTYANYQVASPYEVAPVLAKLLNPAL